MALDFLGDGSSSSGGGDFLSGIGGLLNAFGVGRPKLNYGPTASESQANSLFQALLDPNNSLVKQNSDVNMQSGMQNLLMQLKQMQMLSQRSQARGGRPAFFNPERADETINYLLTRGQPAIADRARLEAKGDIRNTAQSLMSFVPTEQARITAQNNNSMTDAANFQAKGGFGQFGGGLQELLRMLSPQTSAPQSYGPWQQQLPWQTPGNANPNGGYY